VIAALPERVTDDNTPGVLVAALLAIRQRSASQTISNSIDKAVEALATGAGVTAVTLIEQGVPTYGLDGQGSLRR